MKKIMFYIFIVFVGSSCTITRVNGPVKLYLTDDLYIGTDNDVWLITDRLTDNFDTGKDKYLADRIIDRPVSLICVDENYFLFKKFEKYFLVYLDYNTPRNYYLFKSKKLSEINEKIEIIEKHDIEIKEG